MEESGPNRIIGSRMFSRLVGALLLAAAIGFTLPDPQPRIIEYLRLLSYDTLCRLYPGKPSGVPVVIVDIDLASLEKTGQWPWPRDVTAELVRKIHAGNPRVVGIDIVFGEPDRTSPLAVLQHISNREFPPDEVTRFFASLPDHDGVLADAVGAGPTVLGFPFSFDEVEGEPPPPPPPVSRFVTGGADPIPFIPYASFPDRNLPELEDQAAGIGFFNVAMFSDGIVRSVPTVIACGDELYPSLALEMLRVGQGGGSPAVKSSPTGVEAVKAGGTVIPTDKRGNAWFRYRGGAYSFPYIPAHRVLSGELPPSTFEGAYVLVGTSAAGLMDLRATPFSPAFPGVEVHAHMIDTALAGDFLRKPDWAQGAERAYLLMIGLILIVLTPRVSPLRSGLIVLIVSGGVVFFGWWGFVHQRFILDIGYPLAATLAMFSSMTFVNYLMVEREKMKIRGAFGQYLSPVVVEELVKHPERLTLTGEEREMTILFSDIRGFTSFSETMTPKDLTLFLNEYMTPMTHHVLESRGTVDKYIGDAIMAFWNAPLTDPHHAINACRAALAMQRELAVLRAGWASRGYPEVHIGIGINTGLTRVGNMGSKQRFNYTVIGDSVNLASRLEGLSKRYGAGIIISEFTKTHLEDTDLVTRRLDRVRVKGKSMPVTILEPMEERGRMTADELAERDEFEEALDLYYSMAFSDALDRFDRLQRRREDVPLYRIYAARASALLADPPMEGWDGVTTLNEK